MVYGHWRSDHDNISFEKILLVTKDSCQWLEIEQGKNFNILDHDMNGTTGGKMG